MRLYHQTGHNYIWNIDSHIQDFTGDGLIISPVNIEYDKLTNKIDKNILENSFIDPQFYNINKPKSKLSTYPFFPANIKENFNTNDLSEQSYFIAKQCIDFQIENNFECVIIPARYFDDYPSKYYDDFYECLIKPFIQYFKTLDCKKKLLLTLIVKQTQVKDDESRNKLLNWITNIQDINGVYLIFDTNFTTKQIKDAGYLYNAILLIHYLKLNNFNVHIGYNNTEGLLYSIANPDSISMGSYENVRMFNADRFIEDETKKQKRQPQPRLYVAKLLQWIEYGYIEPIINLYNDYANLFEDSKYKPLMFEPSFNWNFQRPELYKHFFLLFSQQISELPINIEQRIEHLEKSIQNAINIFNNMKDCGIRLDENSDDSHLYFWLNAINMYKKYRNENIYEF